ncbi:MAG: hypothetical protein ACT4PN_00615 [Nitrospiraceae bacterium]
MIQTRHAWADGAENFIGDRAGSFGDVVVDDLLVTLTSGDDLPHPITLIELRGRSLQRL